MTERGDRSGRGDEKSSRRHARRRNKLRERHERLERKLDRKFAKLAEHGHRHGPGNAGGRAAVPGSRRHQRKRGRRTPEERAYRDARRRANRKLSVAIHGVIYGLVLLMLMVVTRSPRVVMIVGCTWGIAFWTHYFLVLVAPSLRQRWIDQEVGQRVEQGVSAQRQAVEGQHVRSLEDLSASIAHEIRNPVTAAKSLVQQMGEDPVSSENIDYARVALDELDRVERSISHLLKYARDEELQIEDVRINDVVDSALETFRDRLSQTGVEVDWQPEGVGIVRGDAEKLRRIIINLVGNAIDALEESRIASPQLHLSSGENLAGNAVWIRICDNGPGIDPETLRKIFSPFYTTKESGTGLGLALSKKVVDAHGGRLEVDSRPGEGAEFVLTLPKQLEARIARDPGEDR